MLIRPHLSPADNRRIQAMLFGNQNGDLRQQLLDGAPFLAELTHTAVPQRAAPGTTATFTRATTKTWSNNDGYLVTGLAGEIGFPGARRVRNLLVGSSENLSNANWTASNITPTSGASDPEGGTTATTITATAANGVIYNTITTLIIGNSCLSSLYVKRRTGAGKIYIRTASAGNYEVTGQVASTWGRIQGLPVVVGATTGYFVVVIETSGDAIDVWHPQLEDVTAQTTQTAGEYVSVGVPSDWAGDELVTNGTFDTDTDWTTDTNITIGGGVMTCTLSGTSVGTSFSVVAGTKYVVSWDCTRYVAGANRVLVRKADTTVIGDQNVTGVTATGRYIREFTSDFTGTVQPQVEFPINGESDVDNVVIKPAYYHGSFVDGVKCFPTDLAGNALTTMLGYQAEGARTNLCLQSQTIATAPWQIGNGIAVTADQYVAPDGTTTMDKLTAIAGNTQHFWYQELTTTAAVHTYSVYLRYVNNQWARIGVYDGVGSFYAAFDILNGVVGSTLGAVTATAIEPMGDGVTWRVSLTATLAANALSQVYLSVVNADDPSFGLWNAVGTEAIGAWGAQLELGSFASSYIPTTTIAVARNADVLTYSSAGNISETAGWVYAEVGTRWTTSTTNVAVTASSSSYPLGVNNGNVSTVIVNRDGTNYSSKTGLSDMATGVKKRASSWSGAGLQVTGDGLSPGTNNYDGAYGNGALLAIGSLAGGTLQWNGTIRNVRIGQRQLSASELGAITA